MTDGHDHARPGRADQLAVTAVAANILTGTDPAVVHDRATPPGTCPACTIVTAVQLGFGCCTALAGLDFMTEELRAQLLAFVQHAEAELRAAGN